MRKNLETVEEKLQAVTISLSWQSQALFEKTCTDKVRETILN